MEEIWKDIEDYKGKYQVSNLGRVKSLKDNHGGYREKIMILSKEKKGYLVVGLCKNNYQKRYKVHRLVALAFRDNIDHKEQVNHIDGDKTNNMVSNLEWVTCEENVHHAWNNGLAYNSKMPEETKNKIRNANKGIKSYKCKKVICITTGEIFDYMKQACKKYNMHTGNITRCCKGKRKHCGKLPNGTKLKWMYYEDYLNQLEKGE